METAICRHIKTNGRRCKSPCLGVSAFCYFHSRLLRRHRNLVKTAPTLPSNQPDTPVSATGARQYLPEAVPLELDLPPLEDVESIQVSISLLVAALARNRVDSKRAAVLLYGLQLASTNARSRHRRTRSHLHRPCPRAHQIGYRSRSRPIGLSQ